MNTPAKSPSAHAPRAASYALRLASDAADIEAAQRLRFEVFNLELNEGLDTAYLNGRDADRFDECCDHLLVEEARSGSVVGTYRLQTGQLAAANHGYYSAQEFDFAPFEPIRCETVELGRACVHKDHRRLAVLNLLWRGIAIYAVERKAHYLIGCSSLASQDAGTGAAMYEALTSAGHLVDECFRTEAISGYRMPVEALTAGFISLPPRAPIRFTPRLRCRSFFGLISPSGRRFAGRPRSIANSRRSIS